MRDLNDYGSDRRNCEERNQANLQLGEKVERPVHDSSLLSQFFWGPDDEEMESRPPERKRKWKRYTKMRGAASKHQQEAGASSSDKCNNTTNWHDLPMELLVRVLTLVDNRTVVTASGVCRGWRESVGQGIHDLSFSW